MSIQPTPLVLSSKTISHYLASPDGDGPWPAVVVLHEAFGLNADICRIADRFAANGYLALAPDLVGGGRIRCLARAFFDLSRGEGPVVDLATEVVDWLTARQDCDSGRVGVVGFCMGGGFAFLLGLSGKVGAVAPSYAAPPKELERLAGSCPVVASYGARDRVFAKFAEPVRHRLEEAGVSHDVRLYADAGHSFMNKPEGHRIIKLLGRPLLALGYRPTEAEDAWRRILAFFARHL